MVQEPAGSSGGASWWFRSRAVNLGNSSRGVNDSQVALQIGGSSEVAGWGGGGRIHQLMFLYLLSGRGQAVGLQQ